MAEMTDREKELGAKRTADNMQRRLEAAQLAALAHPDVAVRLRAAKAVGMLKQSRDNARAAETEFKRRQGR